MRVLSVSCWSCLNKKVASPALVGSPIRFAARRPSPHATIATLPDSSVCLITTLYPGTDSVLEQPGALVVKRPLSLALRLAILSSTEVRTFERRGAHFRGTDTHFGGQIQVHFTRNTVLRPSLTVGKLSHGIGAHFRGIGCALSRDRVRTFERWGARFRETRCALSSDVFRPN